MDDIILFDNQDITRIGIESLIRQNSFSSTIFQVDNKAALIKNLIHNSKSIVILDYVLSDFRSIDELLNVGYRFPQSRWFLFSDELSQDFLHRLFIHSDSYSVVLKSANLDEIKLAISYLMQGKRFICERVTNQLLKAKKDDSDKPGILTPTEIEILREIALGRTTKEIASVRNLSFHTVNTHRKNIFRKLDVNNVYEAIRFAAKAGFIDLAEYYI